MRKIALALLSLGFLVAVSCGAVIRQCRQATATLKMQSSTRYAWKFFWNAIRPDIGTCAEWIW